jgi:hypothetical protein
LVRKAEGKRPLGTLDVDEKKKSKKGLGKFKNSPHRVSNPRLSGL